MAAPVGGKVFSEILPYLEVNQGNKDEIQEMEKVETPDIMGKTVREAEQVLKERNLNMSMETEEVDKEVAIIKEQVPQAGITVNSGSLVYVKIE